MVSETGIIYKNYKPLQAKLTNLFTKIRSMSVSLLQNELLDLRFKAKIFKDAEHLIVFGILNKDFNYLFTSRVYSIVCSVKCLVKLL